jgi:hypothetical protein
MQRTIALFLLGLTLSTQTFAQEATSPTESPAPAVAPAGIEELTARVQPSVVIIRFAGRDGAPQGIGSGFVIGADGLIATNPVIGEARPISVGCSMYASFRSPSSRARSRARSRTAQDRHTGPPRWRSHRPIRSCRVRPSSPSAIRRDSSTARCPARFALARKSKASR